MECMWKIIPRISTICLPKNMYDTSCIKKKNFCHFKIHLQLMIVIFVVELVKYFYEINGLVSSLIWYFFIVTFKYIPLNFRKAQNGIKYTRAVHKILWIIAFLSFLMGLSMHIEYLNLCHKIWNQTKVVLKFFHRNKLKFSWSKDRGMYARPTVKIVQTL